MRRSPSWLALSAVAVLVLAGCDGDSSSRPGDDITDDVQVPGFVLAADGASLSPDGDRIAVPCHDRVCVWGVGGSLEEEWDGAADLTAWSPDGAWLATASAATGEVVWRDTTTGEPAATATVDGVVRALTFGPDGDVLAVATDVGLTLHDGLNGVEVAEASAGGVADVAFSPDGLQVLVARAEAPPELLESGMLAPADDAPDLGPEPATDVAWNDTGTRVALGGADGVRIVEAATGGEVDVLDQPEVTDVAFDPAGDRLAVTTAAAPELVLWAPGSDPEVEDQHSAAFGSVLWTSGGLYTVAPDVVLSWNLETGDVGFTFDLPPDA